MEKKLCLESGSTTEVGNDRMQCACSRDEVVFTWENRRKVVLGKRVTPLRKEGNPTGRVILLTETSAIVSCKHSILDSLEIIEKLARLG